MNALAIFLEVARLQAVRRDRLCELNPRILTDGDECAAFAPRRLRLMNEFRAERVAVEFFGGAQGFHDGRDVRGVLDAERMTFAPELTGPCGLKTRVDGVALDDRELELPGRLLRMRPHREFLI